MVDFKINNVEVSYDIRGDTVVVMCPPHPLMGGNRFDVRLERITSELLKRGISVLRLDYRSPFRNGVGEVEDVKTCIAYLKDRHSSIVIVGYSFGSVVASNVAEYCDAAVYISPLKKINAIEFLDSKVPKLFVIATKDDIVPLEESLEIYESASEPKKLVKLETDHFYFGKFDVLTKEVCDFICSL